MSKKCFRPEEIIGKFRHADLLLGQGQKVAAVVKALGGWERLSSGWRPALRTGLPRKSCRSRPGSVDRSTGQGKSEHERASMAGQQAVWLAATP